MTDAEATTHLDAVRVESLNAARDAGVVLDEASSPPPTPPPTGRSRARASRSPRSRPRCGARRNELHIPRTPRPPRFRTASRRRRRARICVASPAVTKTFFRATRARRSPRRTSRWVPSAAAPGWFDARSTARSPRYRFSRRGRTSTRRTRRIRSSARREAPVAFRIPRGLFARRRNPRRAGGNPARARCDSRTRVGATFRVRARGDGRGGRRRTVERRAGMVVAPRFATPPRKRRSDRRRSTRCWRGTTPRARTRRSDSRRRARIPRRRGKPSRQTRRAGSNPSSNPREGRREGGGGGGGKGGEGGGRGTRTRTRTRTRTPTRTRTLRRRLPPRTLLRRSTRRSRRRLPSASNPPTPRPPPRPSRNSRARRTRPCHLTAPPSTTACAVLRVANWARTARSCCARDVPGGTSRLPRDGRRAVGPVRVRRVPGGRLAGITPPGRAGFEAAAVRAVAAGRIGGGGGGGAGMSTVPGAVSAVPSVGPALRHQLLASVRLDFEPSTALEGKRARDDGDDDDDDGVSANPSTKRARTALTGLDATFPMPRDCPAAIAVECGARSASSTCSRDWCTVSAGGVNRAWRLVCRRRTCSDCRRSSSTAAREARESGRRPSRRFPRGSRRRWSSGKTTRQSSGGRRGGTQARRSDRGSRESVRNTPYSRAVATRIPERPGAKERRREGVRGGVDSSNGTLI